MNKVKKAVLFLSTIALSGAMISCNSNNGGDTPTPGDDFITPPAYKEDSISFHYKRNDTKYDNWALWLWAKGGEGKEYTFNGTDAFGAIAAYPLSTFSSNTATAGLGFIVKSAGSWSAKDPDGDRFIDFSKFEKDDKNIYHVYLQTNDSNIYANSDLTLIDEITTAQFTSSTQIAVSTNTNIVSYKIYENDSVILEKTLSTPNIGFRCVLPDGKKASFENSYRVEVVFEKSGKTLSTNLSTRSLYKTTEFANDYNYDGDDLGVTYAMAGSTFKVWSPISSKVSLRIYDNGTPSSVSETLGSNSYKEYEMSKGDKGVWSTYVNLDLAGKYYTYIVTNSEYKVKEIVDPYAKSCGINGLRGMIVDFSKTNPDNWGTISAHQYDRKSLTVYETHVADITSSATWTGKPENSKTFNGAYESGTTYTTNNMTVKTGFDNIKELGVNAVQFIPIFDQANDENNKTFNWGYNPLNYNCLEGSYSSNPYDGYTRIKEFKNLVKAYNESSINIIMDVVYNHVNSAQGSNFDVLMPGYFYRYNGDGTLSNGSGCGNETASEMYMCRKFMIDSASFWAKEYKLGGFRFDLMGLHDLETMDDLTAACKAINPSICIYGEPWSGGTSTLTDSLSAKQVNGNLYKGYGQFNDQMRDALIKGGLNGTGAKGWVTNTTSINVDDSSKIQGGIRGITSITNAIKDPNKTVNYVTCHDNYTLYDRIKAAGINDESTIKKMAMLANSVVFTSQGTTFMLAGEEFLRTKQGNGNSYNASYAVNELDYGLKVKNIDMFNNYKKLIALKQSVDGLHLDTPLNQNLDYSVSGDLNEFVINIKDTERGLMYKIAHTNGFSENTLDKVDFDGYQLYLDTLNRNDLTLSKETKLNSFETIIAYKDSLL